MYTTDPTCKPKNSTTSTNNSSSGVTGHMGCSDSDSGCKSGTGEFKNRKKTANVTIYDAAGNSKSCEVKIKQNEYSWSSWSFVKMLTDSTQSQCKVNGSSGKWETDTEKREYLNCAVGNLPTNGVCGGSSRCDGCTGNGCKKGCCIKKTRSAKYYYSLVK